ncbi:MAG TPA: hypothetical protein V6D03_02950, partial [Candidatus Caenarcaniphilales bacterium]
MTNSSQRRALVVRQSFSPFGNKLVQSGYVNQEQVRQASLESRKSGRPLIEVLERLTGKPLPPDLQRQYKRQQLFELKILYGVESLDPELDKVPSNQISQLINTLIPIDICRRYQLVPLSRSSSPTATAPEKMLMGGLSNPAGSVLIAMVDPENLGALDDLGRILRSQNLSLQR